MSELEARDVAERIRRLEQTVYALSTIIAEDPCRKALKAIIDGLDKNGTLSLLDTILGAKRALAETEPKL